MANKRWAGAFASAAFFSSILMPSLVSAYSQGTQNGNLTTITEGNGSCALYVRNDSVYSQIYVHTYWSDYALALDITGGPSSFQDTTVQRQNDNNWSWTAEKIKTLCGATSVSGVTSDLVSGNLQGDYSTFSAGFTIDGATYTATINADGSASYTKTSSDSTAPTLSSSTPADNATSVAVNANIVLNFSEAVDAESGNITIKKTSDNTTVATIDVTSGMVTGSGTSTITINPSSDLAGSTEHYVLIDSTAFDDAAGNSYAGISSTTALSFTTVDSTAPMLSSSTPADNATSVAVNANIVLNFSEAVDAESGNITIKKTSDNTTVATIGVTSGLVTGSGTSTITINPSSDFSGSTEYYVLIDSTAFDDAAGNSYAGISSTTALSFTTVVVDSTAPTMTITAAEVSDGDSSDDATLSLTFTSSEATSNFAVGDISVANATLSSFSAVSSTVYTATLTPSAAGAVTVDVASGAFTDAAGNNNTAASQFNWTYAPDTTAPTMTITAAEVSDGDSSDDATLSLTFTSSEATSNFAVGDISVANATLSSFSAVSSTVYTATLTPSAAGAVTVDVASGAFTDAAGNNNTAASQFNWTYGANPLLKADVTASIDQFSGAAVRFNQTSVKLVNTRLSWLRANPGSTQTSRQGVTVSFADPLLDQFVNGSGFSPITLADAASWAQRYGENPDQVMSDAELRPLQMAMAEAREQLGLNMHPTGEAWIGDWSLWTEGRLTIGKSSGKESDSYAISMGLDRPLGETSRIGFAAAYGQDDIDIGSNGSGMESDNYSFTIYSAFYPENLMPMEAQLGVGHMQIDNVRVDGSQTLRGSRNAKMLFGSFAALHETFVDEDFALTPYGRVEAAYIELDPFSETGGNLALSYAKQRVHQAMVFLGSEARYQTPFANGRLHPFAKLEYGLDLTGSSDVNLSYVGDSTNYRFNQDKEATSHWIIGLGADYVLKDGLNSSFSYEREQAVNSGHSDTYKIRLTMRF